MVRFVLAIFFSNHLGLAVAETLPPGELSFPNTVIKLKEDQIPSPKLGFVVTALNGGGVLYEKSVTAKRHQFFQIVTNGMNLDFGPGFTPSRQVGRVERDTKNLIWAVGGLDQKLWVFGKQRDYAVTAGLGLGVQYVEYNIQFYPGVCPNGGPCLPKFFYNVISSHESKSDWPGILRARLGYRIYDTRAAGILSDVTFLFGWNILRYPEIPKIIGPDGEKYEMGSNGEAPLMFEFASAF